MRTPRIRNFFGAAVTIVLAIIFLFLAACQQQKAPGTQSSASADTVDRTVLPIKEPAAPTYTELDARNAKAPPRFAVKAPQGAPNVVVVLIDDIGFGATSSFGGPINMPTMDKLAADGLRYNRFHTTALCSPTWSAPAERSGDGAFDCVPTR